MREYLAYQPQAQNHCLVMTILRVWVPQYNLPLRLLYVQVLHRCLERLEIRVILLNNRLR